MHGVAALIGFVALLGAPAGSSASRAQDGVAPGTHRERPRYELAVALARSAGSRGPGASEARRELEKLVTELAGEGFGLDTLDPDRLLASSAALSYLARNARHAAELGELCAVVEEALESESDPDLALALAQGRLALSAVESSEGEEAASAQLAALRLALRHARSIDSSDRGDGFGCQLAGELHRRLLAAGRVADAREELTQALLDFPDDVELRPYLACMLADECRVAGAFDSSWHWLREAEAALASRPEEERLQRISLERSVAGTRCQLELACGLVDLAAVSLERERAASRNGADELESQLDVLLNVSGVALGSTQPDRLREALDELDDVLADPASPLEPAHRAQLRARSALLQEMLEDTEGAEETSAAELIDEALADPNLDPLHRRYLQLKAIDLAHRAGDYDGAARRLAAVDPESTSSPELRATLSAWRTMLALAGSPTREEVERLEQELEQRHAEFLASWSSAPERAGGLGYLGARDRLLFLGARLELCLRLGGEAASERAVDLLLPDQALGSLARRLGAQPGSLAELRGSVLDPDIGLLLYLPGHGATHLFCIDCEEIIHERIPWKYLRERLPRELDDLLAHSPAELSESERSRQRAELERIAGVLGRRLLPDPARARLARWKGVYVIGADLLGGIAFDCLPLDGQALGLARDLAYLPSVPVALALRERGYSMAARDLLLVAAPARDDDSRLAALPFDVEDARELSAGFERVRVLSGREATRDAAAEEQRREPALVQHFLAHGVSDVFREGGAGLALATSASDPDGFLWSHEITPDSLPASRLVVLSACGAARGPRRMGDDGIAHLGGAFLAAGARCVLLPAGKLALEPALALVKSFQRELQHGRSPAQALRAARQELVREEQFEHPFYWASWRVMGLAGEPLFEERPPR